MLYFKTIIIDNADGRQVETAVRQCAAKRHLPLDIHSSIADWGSDKLFLGVETETSIKITRTRSSFERFLPKLIIRFDKENTFLQYKIRYSLRSTIVFVLILLLAGSNIIDMLRSDLFLPGVLFDVLLLGIFLLFTWLEFRITKSKLNKAITRSPPIV